MDIHKQLAMARLPSLPQALLRLLDLAEREDVGLTEIGNLIAQDPGLAARVLSTANSAYYSRGRRLDSIPQCLAVMGVVQVRRIALNQSVAELFGRFQNTGGFDIRHFWFHGLGVAITARELAKRLHYPNIDEAYLAGLLHDVGQLAILTVAPDQYLSLFRPGLSEKQLMQAEQSTFALTHPEVGAWLAQRWHMQGYFADALLYHHEPLEGLQEEHLLIQVVNLANLFNNLLEGEVELQDADLAFWSLPVAEALAMAEAAEVEARELAGALGIEIQSRKAQPAFSALQDETPLTRLAEVTSDRLQAKIVVPEHVVDAEQAGAAQDVLRAAKMLFATSTGALFMAQGRKLRTLPADVQDNHLAALELPIEAGNSAISRAYGGVWGMVDASQENPAVDSSKSDLQVLHMLGRESMLCLGLSHAGQTQGVLVLGLAVKDAREYLQRRILLSSFAREGGRRLAQARQQAEREDAIRTQAQNRIMADFQQQARQVIHEVNNPLGVVRNYISLLREQLSDRQKAQEDMDLVENELRRVARILQELKSSGSKQAVQPDPLDINALIREVVRFCRLGHPELEKMHTRLELDESLPPLRIPGDPLKQVLTNLLLNSVAAMHPGGEITLSTAQWRSPGMRPSVEIAVRDTGPGLPPKVLEALYDPPDTAGGGPENQGLGLAIVQRLVQDLGGTLHCHSSPSGTTFKILLPIDT